MGHHLRYNGNATNVALVWTGWRNWGAVGGRIWNCHRDDLLITVIRRIISFDLYRTYYIRTTFRITYVVRTVLSMQLHCSTTFESHIREWQIVKQCQHLRTSNSHFGKSSVSFWNFDLTNANSFTAKSMREMWFTMKFRQFVRDMISSGDGKIHSWQRESRARTWSLGRMWNENDTILVLPL